MFVNKKLLMAILVFLMISIIIIPTLMNKSADISTEKKVDDVDSTTAPIDKVFKYTKGQLNMRKGPGVDYELIMTLPSDAKVEFIEQVNEWDKVSFDENIGYCASSFLVEKIEGEDGSIIIPEAPVKMEDDVKVIEFMKEINGIILVNRDFALPKEYAPGENKEAKSYLNSMIKACKDEVKLEIVVFSGYRSFNHQEKVYNDSFVANGEEYTSKYVAKAGHSEHQTGLAFDIGGNQSQWGELSFAKSKEASWLNENAHRFGFIIRYPEDKEDITGYGYEPWHIRYVGLDNATYIYENKLTLEEFLINSN